MNREEQNDIDAIYEQLCDTITGEMDNFLQKTGQCADRMKRKHKIGKPFWNAEVSLLWKNMADAEKKMYRKCKCRSAKYAVKLEYK